MNAKHGSPWHAIEIFILAGVLTGALAACDSAPSEAEFHAACMSEGQPSANLAMSQALGLDRDAVSKCSAKAARASLPPDGYRLLVVGMQGKRKEAAALQARMTDADKLAVMTAALEVFGKCAGGE